ncbi:MAG: hypothetical protein CJD30_11035 [Sulfuricurvum sp. PD_MW2]|jgi:HD-GYP domain-containing protein (c-di-GMP phosphodiesterase class II)|uniref:HD-GYP domain-containing protein n=1 Tax=Sulfuricurvum sp. PD_MW2 TaxID=2027917 RepID=UPI000C065BA6|nr:HD domain-containing phosphohydrolase [Sulfuricurvum sp. PD_MW2]PHM16549.1 MAG: hypothetical protein CJD30_11035 [Sulfuricurvum sp. PD_MW2]
MAKVVRVVINSHFSTIKLDMLRKGEPVPFDMYVKRYNDFVIIIEAGTVLDEVLYEKLSQHLQIYISKNDSKKLQEYTVDLNDENPQKGQVSRSQEKLSESTDLEKQLASVYSSASDLMESIFESGNEKLPLDAISNCVYKIVNTFESGENVLPLVLKIFPNEYSTHDHSIDVAYLAAIIGKMIKLNNQELFNLIFAALLHDVGKLRIDDTILEKTSFLEDDEFESVKLHSELGYEILKLNGIDNQTVLKGVRYHHERLDGSGYPEGLKGKMIPRSARIIAICDVFDALTTNRTYRTHFTSFEALLLMKREMHTQLDETFVDMLIQLHR